jgi:succinate dehydrogenase flavin-adding protein (antitoxin of CptAB toxin-antitoxin module)
MNCVLEVDHVCSQRLLLWKEPVIMDFYASHAEKLKTDDVDENYHIFRDDDQQLCTSRMAWVLWCSH